MQVQAVDVSKRRLTDQECLQSFVIASNARSFVTKREILMGAHIIGAALFRYGGFKFHLQEQAPELLSSSRELARKVTSGKLQEKFTLADNLYETLYDRSLSCLQDMLPHARAYDEENRFPLPVADIVSTGIDFLRAENAGHHGLNENGTTSLNYINPFITMRACVQVSGELFKTISEDTYSGERLMKAINGIDKYTTTIYEKYPVGLTVRDATYEQRRDVLENMTGLVCVIREQMDELKESKQNKAFRPLDPALEPIVLRGLATVEQYLEPFTRPLPTASFDVKKGEGFESNVIPYFSRHKKDILDTFHVHPAGPGPV